MGADMLLTGCPLPIDSEGAQLAVDLELAALQLRIPTLADDVLVEVASWLAGDEIDTDQDGWQDRVGSRLDECLAVLDASRRDTAELYINDRWWIFAGGMSSGDAPSDAYEMLNALVIAGITQAPFTPEELEAAAKATSRKEDK